jgi:hypothetical protein
MLRRLSLWSAVALALGAGAFVLKAVAQEVRPKRLACPSCREPREGASCAKDGSPLVRSDLVVFDETITRLAAFESKEKGLENPVTSLVAKDGLPDISALEKLVSDYKAARAQNHFTAFSGRLPLAPPSPKPSPEKGAIAALKAVVTAEALLGYVFEAEPSSSEPLLRFYAKASPVTPGNGARYFFTNQVGLVYASSEPFAVDPKTC